MNQPQAAKGMRVFFLVWFGQLVSLIGSGLTNFALGVWVYQQTGSVTQFALIYLFASIPVIAISPIAGVVVDRFPRRWVMILSDFAAGLSTVAIALLVVLGRLEIWQIYLATALNATFSAFQWPAYNAATTLLVPKKHLARANGTLQLGEALSQLVAPLFAGFLLTIIELQGIIFIDFITFLFALGTLLSVRFPKPKTKSERKFSASSLVDEVVYGWNYLAIKKGLLGLMIFFAVANLLVGIVQVLVTPLVLSFGSSSSLGLILSTGGIGMVAGSLVMSIYGVPYRRTNNINNVLIFMLLESLCIASAGLHTDVLLLSFTAFCVFFCPPIINSSTQVIFNKKVTPEVQGRVFALKSAIATSSLPLASLVAGPLVDKVFEPLMSANGALAGTIGQVIGVGDGRGIGLLFIVVGGLTILITIAAYQYPRLRLVETELPDILLDEASLENERRKKYRNLISALLTLPHQTTKILEINHKLLDADLVMLMADVAGEMSANGSTEASVFLQNLIARINLAFSQYPSQPWLKPQPPSIFVRPNINNAKSSEMYRDLISALLTFPHKADEILASNPKLINGELIEMLDQVSTKMARFGSTEAATFLSNQSHKIKQNFMKLT